MSEQHIMYLYYLAVNDAKLVLNVGRVTVDRDEGGKPREYRATMGLRWDTEQRDERRFRQRNRDQHAKCKLDFVDSDDPEARTLLNLLLDEATGARLDGTQFTQLFLDGYYPGPLTDLENGEDDNDYWEFEINKDAVNAVIVDLDPKNAVDALEARGVLWADRKQLIDLYFYWYQDIPF